MGRRAKKVVKKTTSVLDQPGRVWKATTGGAVGAVAGSIGGGMAGYVAGGSKVGNVTSVAGGVYGTAAGARRGWVNSKPVDKNPRTRAKPMTHSTKKYRAQRKRY